jgi:hypothetical protein
MGNRSAQAGLEGKTPQIRQTLASHAKIDVESDIAAHLWGVLKCRDARGISDPNQPDLEARPR